MAISTATQQGIEIGRRALQAQQAGLNVTSNNVANANTAGFSRRQLQLEAAVTRAGGSVGTGAEAASVTRQRSALIDGQARTQQQVLGYWEAKETSLGSLESIFDEPAGAGTSEAGAVFDTASGTGLSSSLSRFWNTWQDLANAPESGAARAAVRQEGELLSATLRQSAGQLQQSRAQLDDQVAVSVTEINSILDQLGRINAEMPRARASANGAGDLEDQRDRLVDQLSGLVEVGVSERDNGQLSVVLGGREVVAATHVVGLSTRQLVAADAAVRQVVFADDHTPAVFDGGRVQGLIEVRDQVAPALLGQLDQLAAGLVTAVNQIHTQGYGRDGSAGVSFFDPAGTTASTITLDPAVVDDLSRVAASLDGTAGDNGTALALAGLRRQALFDGAQQTAEEFYASLLGQVGAQSQEAQTMAGNQRLFAQQIENRRQSIQGVSLNDEAAQLVLFQRAYQAAARTVSVVDDMLATLVNI